MKKLICLVFALAMVCSLFFAFNVNAEDGTLKNIAGESTITTNAAADTWWIQGNKDNLKDGDPTTGMHSSNNDGTTVVTFNFEAERRITKIVMLVNGSATTSAVSPTDMNAATDYKVTVGGYTETKNALDQTELVFNLDQTTNTVTIEFYSGWSWENALIREVEIYEYIPPVEEVFNGKNIEDEATIETTDGNSYIVGGSNYLIDNDPTTGLSAGNAASWINYHFLYEEGRNINRVVVVVNSTGTMYKVGSADGTYVHETMSTLPNIYLRLYNSKGEIPYKLEGVDTKHAKEITTADGKKYMAYTFDLGGEVYPDIVKVEIATVHNKDTKLGVWEVEIFEHQCELDGHKFAAATCAAPETCIYCGETQGEVSAEHTGTWSVATCTYLSKCSVCGATTGELDTDNHVWKNATCNAPKTCVDCLATEGEATGIHDWVDVSCAAPKHCSGCGLTEGEALPHANILKDGNCATDDKCRVCKQVAIAAVSHNLDSNGYCTNDGCYFRDIEKNVASSAEVTTSPDAWWAVGPKWWVDGDWNTGSHAPKSSTFSYIFTYGSEMNFSRFVVVANGLCYAANDGKDANNDAIIGVKVILKDANGNKVYETAAYSFDGVNDVEIVLPYPMTAVSATFTFTSTQQYGSSFVREIEIYEPKIDGCGVHNFGVVQNDAATCTEDGSYSVVCSVCQAVESVHVIPATGHTIGDDYEVVDRTCTSAPKLQFSCSVCGMTELRDIQVNDIIDRADKTSITTIHSGGGTTAATMFDGSLDTWTQASGSWAVIGTINFDRAYYLSTVTVWLEGSSVNAGFIVFYQTPGSEEWIQVNDAMVVYAPWGKISEFTLEIKAPVYASAIKVYVGDPDGTPQGGGPGLASFQGRLYDVAVTGALENEIAAGHTWVAGETVAPGCATYGYTLYTCSVCGTTKEVDFVKEAGHKWVDATCVAPKTCTVCAATEGDANPDAHNYDDGVVTEPTCTAGGYTTYTCTACGNTYTDKPTDVIDHTYAGAFDMDCDKCGYVRGVAYIGETYYATFADAVADAVAGDTIVALDKVVVEGDVIWDLAGITVSFTAVEGNYSVVVKGNLTINGGNYIINGLYGIGVATTGTLTINDGIFTTTSADYMIGSWGTTTIRGGEFNGAYCCVNAFDGTATISGGTFTTNYTLDDGYEPMDVLGAAVITGGSFSTDVSENLMEGYILNYDEENGTYTAALCTHEWADADCVTAKTCSVCGETEGEALGHTYEDAFDMDCDRCGYVRGVAYIGEKYYATFADAVANAVAGDTIVLLANVASEEILTINGSITIDGNGYTLTSTAIRAINVDTTGTVSIENLTINAGERAINIINKAATVVIDNVTATAKNNAVMIATSAGAAKVTISNSDLTGLAVINVAGAGSVVAIENTTITNVDATDAENYGAITISGTAVEAKVTVTGGSITVADDSKDAYVFPANATITGVDDENVGYVIATIGDAGYDNLADAITDSKGNLDAIVVVRPEKITEMPKGYHIEGNKVVADIIDNAALNGKYVLPGIFDTYFTFNNGTLVIEDENPRMASGYAGTYTYTYNVTTGAIETDLNANLSVANGTIYVSGKVPLSVYVPAVVAVLGTNTTIAGEIKFVFTAATDGKYIINANGMMIVVENMYGSEMFENSVEIDLVAGMPFEFIIISDAEAQFDVAPAHVCSFTESNRVDSTCTTKGSVTYTCTCGKSYTVELELADHNSDVVIPAVRPTPSKAAMSAGAKCSVCGTVTVEQTPVNVTTTPSYKTFGIGSTSLSITENISVNYKVNVSAGYTNPYMYFIFEGGEYSVDEYYIETSSGRYVFNFDMTRPQLMNSVIKAYVYGETANGYAVDVYDYSVKQYCVYQLKESNNAILKTAISDLVVYGALTQKYLNANVSTANLITTIVQNEGCTLTPSTFGGISNPDKAVYNDVDKTDDLEWRSTTVAMGSSTELVFKFAATDISNLQIKVNAAGEEYILNASDLVYKNERYEVRIDCLTSWQYGERVTATFIKNGVESDSVTDGINDYLGRNVGSYADGNTTGDLMKAIYLFGQSATTYFKSTVK